MLPLLRSPTRASGAAATPRSAAVACLAAAVALAGPPARSTGQEFPDRTAVGAAGAREGREGAPGGLPRSDSADGVGRPASGELHPELTSVADSTQRYALYLPPGWDGSSRRPLLLVMDPRGRAVAALERLREGARRHGWVVMSSHDTRSDTGEPEANRRAVNAMLTDAGSHFSVDTDRIYLAGFAGTARLAWIYARKLSPHVAGTVAVGAGLPLWTPPGEGEGAPPLPDHFAFWGGGSGRLDFNYAEVRRLDGLLDSLGIRHRVAHYEGPHAWLPAEQALRATDWLELVAMRHGLAPVDRPFVDSLRAAWIRRARREEAGGDAAAALENFAVVMNFVVFPMFFLSGALYPVARLPEVLRAAARINPLTYGVDFLKHGFFGPGRGAFGGEIAPWVDLVVLAAWTVAATLLAGWWFGREDRFTRVATSGGR